MSRSRISDCAHQYLNLTLTTLRKEVQLITASMAEGQWGEMDHVELLVLQGACDLVTDLVRKHQIGLQHPDFSMESNAMIFAQQAICNVSSTPVLWHPLHWAIIMGTKFKLSALKIMREKPQLCTSVTETPPHFAPIHLLLSLYQPDYDVLSELLRIDPLLPNCSLCYKENPNDTDIFPVLPVMIAARWCQSAEGFQQILMASTEMRTRFFTASGDCLTHTALQAACMNLFPPVFDMALRADPTAVHVVNRKGKYPVHIAVSTGNIHAVKVLIKPPDSVDESHKYLLHEVVTNHFNLLTSDTAIELLNLILALESGRNDIFLKLQNADAVCSLLPLNLAARYSSRLVFLHLLRKISEISLASYSNIPQWYDPECIELDLKCNEQILSDIEVDECLKEVLAVRASKT